MSNDLINKNIYFDNGATTPLDSKVVEKMLPFFTEKYGNPASIHKKGREAKEALDKARKTIAESIGANPEEIIFTSGGTESNNLALKSFAFEKKKEGKGNHIITTKIEHDCVIKTCKWLEGQGFEITYLPVDGEGFVDPENLRSAITDKTILVSIIHGNNEIGTIQDLKTLGAICREKKVLFHTDACQSYTKTDLDVQEQNIDLMTLNAHKIHGPKGVGALYIRRGIAFKPWQHGGGQERNIRSGTVNVHGIVGFAEAVVQGNSSEHKDYMKKLRDKLVVGIQEKISDVKLNGPSITEKSNERLCNNVNFSFKKIEGEAIQGHLDIKGVQVSTGSACSTKTLEPSHVLLATGMNKGDANGTIRITLSRFNKEEDVDYLLEILPGIVEKLRAISPL